MMMRDCKYDFTNLIVKFNYLKKKLIFLNKNAQPHNF